MLFLLWPRALAVLTLSCNLPRMCLKTMSRALSLSPCAAGLGECRGQASPGFVGCSCRVFLSGLLLD